MSIWENETDVTRCLLDMGFTQWDSVPTWAVDLATQLLDAGWTKVP